MKQKLFTLIFSLTTFLPLIGFGQNVDIQPSIDPTFFTPEEEITITYDVTGTSLSSLSEAWLWLWLPDLTNVDVPSNVNPASSDPSATDIAKFTKSVENGRTLFSISLTLTDFTNKPAEEIERVGVLIKGNDWSNGQSVDYVFEIFDGYALRVNNPTKNFAFYNTDDTISLDIDLSELSDIEVTVDGVSVFTDTNTGKLDYKHAVIDDGNVHTIEFIAEFNSETLTYKHTYTTPPVVTEEAVPVNMVDGPNYISDVSATLVLTAPNKDNVFVIGDFNDWSLDQDYLMKKDGDQFWLTIDGLEPGTEYIYQYLIDGEIVIADPYTEKVSSVYDDAEIIAENRYPGLKEYPHGLTEHEASFLQTAQTDYNWQHADYERPAREDLVVYELLVRDFSEERTFQAVIDKLDYLDSLGINAIELMPINEFEGNLSWGYNPSFKFAPDKYYGTEDKLKELIDKAHGRGMAIILDMVLNHHFGRSPLVRMEASGDFGPPTSSNVWFNTSPKHDFNVGYDFNHESQYTKDYVDRVVTYWTEKYKVDGYRFDLSKGFTQNNTLGNVGAWGAYDASRITLLKRMADVIWEQNPETYVILEHFADNSEERELANYGMMLWGNNHGTFKSTGNGLIVDIDWQYYKARGWDHPHLVSYMESHDEERIMFEISKGKSDDEEAVTARLNRLKQNAAFFFLVPGPKMIWQFGEYGYDEELNNDRLGVKPLHWEYLDDPERAKLFATYQALINLKTKTDYLNEENFDWDYSGQVKWINYDNNDVKICAFGNFGKSFTVGDPHILSSGTWYNYLSGEEFNVVDPNELSLEPGEFYVLTSEPIDNFISIDATSFVTSSNGELSSAAQVFPNPVVNELQITSDQPIRWIKVYDMNGHMLFNKEMDSARNRVEVDFSFLSKGIYICEFETTYGIEKQRVIKQ